jgi:ketosteroid isomerase-like protein
MHRLSLACLLLLAGSAEAQSPADSVRALDSAWARAYATHDTALALRLFADDLIVTSMAGSLKDKMGELADIRPQTGLQMHHFRTSDVTVRVHGDAAVVVGLADWEFTYSERRTGARRRYTAVFARGGPLGWRMIALHLGRAPG